MNFPHCVRLLPFFLILLAGNFCTEKPKEQQSYERIERFENGAISRRVQIIRGEKQGLMTDYYPDGRLLAERWFKDDRQHGRTAIYYPSGKIKEVQYFQVGEQQGGDSIWYENGVLQFAVFFKNNKKDGYLRKWAPTGEVIFEALYSNDTVIEIKGQPLKRDSTMRPDF